MDGQSARERQFHRIALELEYDGSSFCGWQRQLSPRLPTVQATLEEALSRIADSEVRVHCAGRTDRGVHATGQVVHFDTPVDRGSKAWVRGTNSLLPAAVRVRWAGAVAADFHARFSATARRYLYLLYEADILSSHLHGRATRVRETLDAAAMYRAGQYLVGEHDFSAFRAAGCQSRTACRCISSLKVVRKNRFIVVDVQANAFLQHMVRNIVGMLLEVGKGMQAEAWADELLRSRDRSSGAVTAEPDGLYLVRVCYPGLFQLPESGIGPVFLQPYP